MMTQMNVACVQMNSGSDITDNLTNAAVLINDAAKAGAEFVMTPENTDVICVRDKILETTPSASNHKGIPFFSVLAKELGVWLLIGSMKVKISDDKVANRSFLFSNKGQLMASYDKIHMFDADLPNGESYKESEHFEPGNQAVLGGIDGRKLGMTICYDIRFPHLYRSLAKGGAEMIAVPSAFAVPTGKAHWEALLRARAIETGCFIFAPAQVGEHDGGRLTYGHSMIVSPWGEVLAEMTEDKSGHIMHNAKFISVAKARSAVPSLQRDMPFELLKPKLL